MNILGKFLLCISLLLASSNTVEAKLPKSLPDNMVSYEKLIIPIIQNDVVPAYLLLSIVIECTDKAAADHIKARKLRLKDKIYTYMYGLLGIIWDEASTPDILAIKRMALKAVQRATPKDSVKDLLIAEFHVHAQGNTDKYVRQNMMTIKGH
ncbi:MAG: hypothetical protein ACPGXY_01290 [Alphaproteobacteria bacterium]